MTKAEPGPWKIGLLAVMAWTRGTLKAVLQWLCIFTLIYFGAAVAGWGFFKGFVEGNDIMAQLNEKVIVVDVYDLDEVRARSKE